MTLAAHAQAGRLIGFSCAGRLIGFPCAGRLAVQTGFRVLTTLPPYFLNDKLDVRCIGELRTPLHDVSQGLYLLL